MAQGVTQPESLLTLRDLKALGIDKVSSPCHVPRMPAAALRGRHVGFEFLVPMPVMPLRQASGCCSPQAGLLGVGHRPVPPL